GAAWWRTSSVIWAMPARLARSVAEAVIVCTPIERLLAVKLAPVPTAPSRLEVQMIVDDRSPSIVSMAVAVKVIGFPSANRVAVAAKGMGAPKANFLPAAGEVSVRTGAETLATSMVIAALPVRLPVSAARAVIVWWPRLRFERLKVPPVPIWPSRSDVQTMALVRSPSIESMAVPAKVIGWPGRNLLPRAGDVMVTTGGASASTVSVSWLLPVSLTLSVADAVMVCTPADRLEVVKPAPVPIWPSRLEVHLRSELITPSVPLVAVAEKMTGAPARTFVPVAGDAMVTTGTGLGYSIQPCQYLLVSLVEALTRMPLLGSSTC